jgi:hypothetical protein
MTSADVRKLLCNGDMKRSPPPEALIPRNGVFADLQPFRRAIW